MVGRQLKALSLKAPALSPLQVRPTCWWASERSSSDRLALAGQIDQDKLRSIDVGADHFAIMRHKTLLLGVESALATLLAPAMEAEIGG
jgi:hypothetical protein